MNYLIAFIAAAFSSLVLTRLIVAAAPRLGWIAQPKSDRWHSKPTALMGGLAIGGGVGIGILIVLPDSNQVLWLLAGLVTAVVGGAFDDRRGLSPAAKIFVQVLAGLCLLPAGVSLQGLWLDGFGLGAVLAVIWVVVCTNVVNLIDGMDGVAGGVVAATGATAALFGILAGAPVMATLATATTGAAVGFLFFNRYPARVFMGDTGSLALGYLLAVISIMGFNAVFDGRLILFAILPAFLGLPLIDASFVAIVRMAVGRSPADSGTHHVHHRLRLVGISEPLVPVILWAFSFVLGLVAVVAVVSPSTFFVLFLVAVLIVVLLEIQLIEQTGLLPSREGETASKDGIQRVARSLRAMHPWPKVLADATTFAAAMVLAMFVVLGDMETVREGWLAVASVVLFKVAVLKAFGIYRRSWFSRYGTPDLIRLVLAVLVGAVGTTAAEFWLFGLQFGSRIVVADLMASLLAAVAMRAGYRALRHFLAGQRRMGRRVLLYGAGEAGSMAAKEFRLNPSHGVWPVGFLDDDANKHGITVYGLRIRGDLSRLQAIAAKTRAHGVVIASSKIEVERRSEIAEACRAAGLACSEMRLYMRDVKFYNPPAEFTPASV